MGTALSCAGVVKAFGPVRALDGLDLTVERGEVHGYLGPNGSGKTVTIRILLGMLRHDAGSVSLLDGDPWRDAVELHRRLAYVPGDTNLWPNLTGGEVIDLLGALRGGIDEHKRVDLLDRFDLDPTRPSRTYSKGNRQKVALVAALASDAELLVLDEPTSGLDPLMEAVFQQCVLDAKAAGRTVLLSSHILAEVEHLCDRITIIRSGRAVQSGTLAELRHLTRSTVTATIHQPADQLAASPYVHGLSVTPSRLGFDLAFAVDGEGMEDVMRLLADAGLHSLTCQPPTLEELFLRHYGDQLNGREAPVP